MRVPGDRRQGRGDNAQAAGADRWRGRASDRRRRAGPRQSADDRPGRRPRAARAIPADVIIRDGPADHRLRGRGGDRPLERGDHFQRPRRPDRDRTGRSAAVRGRRSLGETRGHASQIERQGHPKATGGLSPGKKDIRCCEGFRHDPILPGRQGRRNSTRAGRDGRESPTTRQAVVGRGASVPAHPDAEGLANTKEPFDIDEAFRRLRDRRGGLPKAAMFDLRDQGYRLAVRATRRQPDLGADAGRDDDGGLPQAVRGGPDARGDGRARRGGA